MRACNQGEGVGATAEWALRRNGALVAVIDAAETPPERFHGKHSGWVLVALQNAFYRLLRAPVLEEGVVATVIAGGDTDPNAAIAGALLGAVHGRDAVRLRRSDVVLSCRALGAVGALHPRPNRALGRRRARDRRVARPDRRSRLKRAAVRPCVRAFIPSGGGGGSGRFEFPRLGLFRGLRGATSKGVKTPLVASSLAMLSAALVACAATAPTSTFTNDATTSGTQGSGGTLVTTGTGGQGGSSTGAGGSGGTLIGTGGGTGTEPAGPPIIYAHTDTTLFELDPTSPQLALKELGDFDCVGGAGQDPAITDFAVDKALTLWGVSRTAVHPLTVQNGSVHCGTPIPLDASKDVSFYALTFAPKGVLDPAKEVLVAGNTAGELWAIDGNGALSQHGTFGKVPNDDGNGNAYDQANVGKAWELSGDVVFLANAGNPVGFATVRDCPSPPSTNGCNPVNTLIEIDVGKLGSASTGSVTKAVRGQIVKRKGCNDATQGDYGNMYGIAAWDKKVYGFSRSGNLVEIDTVDGTGCLVQAYAADKFSGAGVTTLAPIQPPTPK